MIVSLIFQNLLRRPLRTMLTVLGVAVSVGFLACLLSFGEGYQRGLSRELDGMGIQMMLVPLGCPYDAAAQALKGRALDTSLPESALTAARNDPAVAVAAPLFAAALPRPKLGRTDLWVGIDDSTRTLRPWWKLTPGSTWLTGPSSVILGAEAALTELRAPGQKLYSPETGRTFTVCGVLERSGTSDDSQFFVPLATAQAMFHQPGRLTAVALRLKDPALVREASRRLQEVKGAQIVTLSELLGTFLNLMGAAKTLLASVALVAVAVSGLGIFNTMMASGLERTRELAILRALGAGRAAVFGLMAGEAALLSLVGGVLGFVLALCLGPLAESAIRPFVPLAPESGLPTLTFGAACLCALLLLGLGLLAGAYPAWRASRLRPAAALALE